MDTLTIASGLDRFLMPDRILAVTPEEIRIVKTIKPDGIPFFLGLETLAQTGALHVRYLTGFGRHAFLLAVPECRGPSRLEPGIYEFTGRLSGQSKNAYSYDLTGGTNGHRIMSGRFLFSAVPYDSHFRQDRIENHYRKVFSCLMNGTENV